jgi:hypothetical protein
MSLRPVYVIDDQKRVTLGSLAEPGAYFDVEVDDGSLVLQPSPHGRVKVDARRRLALGRKAAAGAMFRADVYADGRIVLAPLLLIDPSTMSPELLAEVRAHIIS